MGPPNRFYELPRVIKVKAHINHIWIKVNNLFLLEVYSIHIGFVTQHISSEETAENMYFFQTDGGKIKDFRLFKTSQSRFIGNTFFTHLQSILKSFKYLLWWGNEEPFFHKKYNCLFQQYISCYIHILTSSIDALLKSLIWETNRPPGGVLQGGQVTRVLRPIRAHYSRSCPITLQWANLVLYNLLQ